jgi:hypothetical protein
VSATASWDQQQKDQEDLCAKDVLGVRSRKRARAGGGGKGGVLRASVEGEKE